VNDDAFLALFALDLPDLTACVPDPLDAIEPLPLPPICGGAPGLLDNAWDFIRDIWGGIGDTYERLAKILDAIWDRIWSWIGGSVRWLYNQFHGLLDWLKDTAVKIWDTVYDILHRFVYWLVPKLTAVWDTAYDLLHRWTTWLVPKLTAVWDTAWDLLHRWTTWLVPKLTSVWDTAYDLLHRWTTWLVPKLTAVWDKLSGLWSWVETWLWPKATDIWDRVTRLIPEAIDSVWHKAVDIWDFLRVDVFNHISGAAQGIGDAVTKAFDGIREGLQEALEALGDKLSDAIRWPWEHIMEPFQEMVERKVAIPGKLFRHEYTRLQDILDDALDPPIAFSATLIAGLIAAMIFHSAFQSCWQSYVNPLFEVELQDQRASIGRELLTPGTVQEALNRGFIDPGQADFYLEKAGYGDPAKKAILELRHLLPGPSDLVRFGVREVFTPEIAEAFGQFEDFPEAFGEIMPYLGFAGPGEATGITAGPAPGKTWAEAYWAAHWDLPSPSQGFEMLHRRVKKRDGTTFKAADLELLLRALDVMPFWRPLLTQISYNPITRVDLRRLHKGGILNPKQVKEGYQDLGYDEEKAGWLRDFTVKYYSPEDESELDDYTKETASQIRLGYRRHVITRQEALDKLVELGYSDDSADFLLALDDVQLALNPTTDADVPVRDLTVSVIVKAYREKHWIRERAQDELETLGYLPWAADLLLQLEDLAEESALRDLEETVVKDQYLANAIDKAQAGAQLDDLDVLPDRRDLLLKRWELQKAQKPKRLTLSQTQKAFKQGLFTQPEFMDELSAMGYNDRDAGIILAITTGTETE